MDERLVQCIIDGLGLGWACLCMAYQLRFREGLVKGIGCVSFGVNAGSEGFDRVFACEIIKVFWLTYVNQLDKKVYFCPQILKPINYE